jgi:small subunit ribosomal protein S14
MARKSLILRNEKRKRMVEKFAAKRAELKAAGDHAGLAKLPKNSSPVRVVNRCAITGRNKGVLRDFGISRIEFREQAHEGNIPGVKKSSW